MTYSRGKSYASSVNYFDINIFSYINNKISVYISYSIAPNRYTSTYEIPINNTFRKPEYIVLKHNSAKTIKPKSGIHN